MHRLAYIFPALGCSLLLSANAAAGVYLESSNASPGEKPTVSHVWFDGGRMRSEQNDDEGFVAIFKDHALYTLEPRSKSYRVMDKAAAEKLGARFADARKKMEAQMANMPPERRAMMEKMMPGMAGGASTPKPVLKNTGRSDAAAGIKCTIWERSVSGKKEEDLCAAAPGSIPGGEEMLKTFRAIGDMLKGFTESFGKLDSKAAPWRDMDTINGVPIVTRDFDEAGKVTSETRLTVARTESVAGSRFDIPAGYTEKKLSFGPDSGN